jgi:hypothetical protein
MLSIKKWFSENKGKLFYSRYLLQIVASDSPKQKSPFIPERALRMYCRFLALHYKFFPDHLLISGKNVNEVNTIGDISKIKLILST